MLIICCHDCWNSDIFSYHRVWKPWMSTVTRCYLSCFGYRFPCMKLSQKLWWKRGIVGIAFLERNPNGGWKLVGTTDFNPSVPGTPEATCWMMGCQNHSKSRCPKLGISMFFSLYSLLVSGIPSSKRSTTVSLKPKYFDTCITHDIPAAQFWAFDFKGNCFSAADAHCLFLCPHHFILMIHWLNSTLPS